MKGDGDRVILAVRDDGAGFDLYSSGNGSRKSGGYGLFSIRERLDTIGGSCIVNSSPRGSAVVLNAPTGGREHIERTYSHRG